jgi:hypothetical protein
VSTRTAEGLGLEVAVEGEAVAVGAALRGQHGDPLLRTGEVALVVRRWIQWQIHLVRFG